MIGAFAADACMLRLPAAPLFAGTKKLLKKGQALLDDLAQQPADVVARSSEYRVHAVTQLPLQIAAPHTVIAFEVADNGFNGLMLHH